MKRSYVVLVPRAGAIVACSLGLFACGAILGIEEATLYEPDAGRGGNAGNGTGSTNTGGTTGGSTAFSCTDGTRNGNETDKDCGGGMCPPCSIGEGCFFATDCESVACSATHVCVAPVCTDMVQNGDESDIDCGGPSCPKCAVGSKCNQAEDCASPACLAGICGGECTPGEKQCVGNIPQTCDAAYQWQSGACGTTAPLCCHGDCLGVVAGVDAGNGYTCARETDSTLWCWGSNSYGQLGDGTTAGKSSPVQVAMLGTAVAQLAAGGSHACARKTDGTLWCWGANVSGQLGDATIINSPSPVKVTALGTSVVQVAAGAAHTCATKTDGTLWCWGYNNSGQLGDGTTVNKGSPTQVTALGTTVAEVAAGDYHTCARKADGSISCWGNNSAGQLGDGTTVDKSSPVKVTALGTNVAGVSGGNLHTCAAKTDGTLWCWGGNNGGALGDGTTVNKSSPVQVTALGTNVAEVAVGGIHTCARKTDGSLWCWGSNLYGQLGDGTALYKLSPVQVATLGTDVAQVAAGGNHTCATKTDGTLWCWGANDGGQLGDGTTTSPVTSPKQLSLGVCQ